MQRRRREAQIRRLPVVDSESRLIGMISLADLAREAARERTATPQAVTDAEVGDGVPRPVPAPSPEIPD